MSKSFTISVPYWSISVRYDLYLYGYMKKNNDYVKVSVNSIELSSNTKDTYEDGNTCYYGGTYHYNDMLLFHMKNTTLSDSTVNLLFNC